MTKLNPRKFIESIVSKNKSIPRLIIYFVFSVGFNFFLRKTNTLALLDLSKI